MPHEIQRISRSRPRLAGLSALFCMMWLYLTNPAFAVENQDLKNTLSPGSAVVLFDQSGSMSRIGSLAISRIWLLTFNQTFANPRQVKLVGFDEDFHEAIDLISGPETGIEAIREITGQIKVNGKATDLESPFRYLSGLKDSSNAELILIISDGEPEIWDAGLGYLSAYVRADQRYADLNVQYSELRRSKSKDRKQFDRLGQLYHQRNLELIDERVQGLPEGIGMKTIIWDISGRSNYLKEWSGQFGAEYLGARISAEERPISQLQKALLKLHAKTSVLFRTKLPADHQSRIEGMLSSVPRLPRQLPDVWPEQQKTSTDDLNKAEITNNEREVMELQLPPNAGGALPSAELERLPTVSSGHNDWYSVGGLFVIGLILLGGSLLSLAGRINQKILVSVPAEFMAGAGAIDGFGVETPIREQRFAERMLVPDGELIIDWTNRDGTTHQANAFDVSLRSVRFKAPDFEAETIDKVTFPIAGISLGISRVRIIRRVDGAVIVIFDEFENNADNWQKWAELVTRVSKAD
jgi:hypothetical protein